VLPTSLLLRDRYESLQKAPNVRVPTLIAHGDRDTLVPLEMGQKLLTALPAAKLYVVKGAGHNDLLRPEVVKEIALFVRADE
jgi:pimeloyl-ACP methyl ester carboxylesterase